MIHREYWKPIFSGSTGQGHEVQKHCRHVSWRCCECWFLLVSSFITGPPTHSVGAVLFCSLASVVVCHRLSFVIVDGGLAGGFARAGQAMTSCRLQSNYSSTVTLHGGPVVLRPVRATPCLLHASVDGRGVVVSDEKRMHFWKVAAAEVGVCVHSMSWRVELLRVG